MTSRFPAILADSTSLSDLLVNDYGIVDTVCLMAIHISAPYFPGIFERHEREINLLGGMRPVEEHNVPRTSWTEDNNLLDFSPL